MTQQYNTLPTNEQPVASKSGMTVRGWYSFWAGLFTGQPTGPVAPLAVGPSPFTYTALQGGTVIVQGGTTTQIRFTRGDGNVYVVGTTAGMFPLSQGDSLLVTYAVPPTMVFVPR